MKHVFAIISLVISLNLFAGDEGIIIYYVNFDKGEAMPIKKFQENGIGGATDAQIEVLTDVTFQTIEGFGGAFNEIGGEALLSLDKEAQNEVLENLFAPDNAGFSLCRTAMGSSDFGLSAYSYSPVEDDYSMEHFTIERDEKYVIPYIQGALKYNPGLFVFASPWSPPAWMKVNGSMDGIDSVNSRLIDDPQVYRAYASYFVKYVQAFDEKGISIKRVCIQNEPDVTSKYPNCIMPADQMLQFTKEYLMPAFEHYNLRTEVYAGTFRAYSLDVFKYLRLRDSRVVDGVGVQYNKENLIHDARHKWPGYKYMHTEATCFNGDNSSGHAKYRFNEMVKFIDAGSTNYCYWNMILNEKEESAWGWKQNSLITINRETSKVTYNPDYNPVYLMSKYIKPGDVRIASFNNRGNSMALLSKNGDLKVLVQNKSDENESYNLKINNKVYRVSLPASALSVIVVKAELVR